MCASVVDIDYGARTVAPGIKLVEHDLDAYVAAVRFTHGGARAFVATGDGRVSIVDREDPMEIRQVASTGDALILAMAPDCTGEEVLLGQDDGRLVKVGKDGEPETVANLQAGWIDTVATHAGAACRAFSSGRSVYVVGTDGGPIMELGGHPSTPAGLCFSPDGGALAVARYNGVTIWDLSSGEQTDELFWRGSHTAVAWSPDGRYIATATQDRDLHCWRLSDGRDFRMSGYSSKVRSISWTHDSAYICASGADTLTSWPCDGNGPAGKPPLEFGYVFNGTVTQAAAHPSRSLAAAGYDDGTVLVGNIRKGDAVIAKPPGGGSVSCLDWASNGRSLIAGTEYGCFAIMSIPDR